MNTSSDGSVRRNRSIFPGRGFAPRCLAVALVLCITACTIGPDYHSPSVQIPDSFKERTDWQRAQANPQGSLSSVWWREYHDDRLTQLVEQSLKANQSIIAAEADYRLALAIVQANTASLFPVVTAGASGSRSGTGANAASTAGNTSIGSAVAGVRNSVSVSAAASWEIDLWGAIRREIESAKESAQATDAQLAGVRLSIAASVAVDYFELRQADIGRGSAEGYTHGAG